MQELTPEDRPREKLARAGARALGDNELVALIIGHGSHGRSVLAVAASLLREAGGVQGLTRWSLQHLVRQPGIGPAQAGRLLAAVELGRRTLCVPARPRPRLLSPADAAAFLLPRYGAHPVEQFGLLLLDARYHLIGARIISSGLVDASLAHPREVFREAVLAAAAAVLVFHNHPSGDPTPSPEDIALTHRLRQAGRIVGVELADHVILADQQYCSLKETRVI